MSSLAVQSSSQASRLASSGGGQDASQKPEIVELLDMAQYTTQVKTSVGLDVPLFMPSPSRIESCTWQPFVPCTFSIKLKNMDSVARKVRIELPESHHFSLSAPQRALQNVAPGLVLKYTLTFKPEDNDRDYQCDLMCVTEREKFIIPVRMSGKQAELQFPPALHFRDAPVKYPSKLSFLLRNVGQKKAKFSLRTSLPFSVSPSTGLIDVGGSNQIIVTFSPPDEGDFVQPLFIERDNDTVEQLQLSGSALNGDVHLDFAHVEMPNTFMNLASRKTVRLFNKSSIPVRYEWRRFSDAFEEAKWREERIASLDQEEDQQRRQVSSHNSDVSEDSLDSDDDSNVSEEDYAGLVARHGVSRQFAQQKRAVLEDQLPFASSCFSITPATGEIFPGGFIELTLTFCPTIASLSTAVAYCEVTGCSYRLPLHMKGQGIGPRARFSYDTLDIGDVFLGAVHNYEIRLHNIGDIPAQWKRVPREDSLFEFEPSSGFLAAPQDQSESHEKGATIQDIRITFCSTRVGKFKEVVEVALQGNETPIRVIFKGVVIGPTFHVDTSAVQFGQVSYGFVNEQEIRIFNTSTVPMKFRLRLPIDEEDNLHVDPRDQEEPEFTIEPHAGTILPDSVQPCVLRFSPHHAKSYLMHLLVDVLGYGDGLVDIPITAECMIAKLTMVQDNLHFGHSYVRHPYTKRIQLSNNSGLPVRFTFPPQDEDAGDLATIVPEMQVGVVKPNTTLDVGVTLIARRLGKLAVPLVVEVAGDEDNPLMGSMNFIGVGPSVVVKPNVLDFGPTAVLRPRTENVVLKNTSPIAAKFKAFLHKKGSPFSLSSSRGVVPPNESVEVVVTANLNDTAPVVDTMYVVVAEGQTVPIKIKAVGTGTTIQVTDVEEQASVPIVATDIMANKTSDEKHVEQKSRVDPPDASGWIEVPTDLSSVELGSLFTGSTIVRRFKIQNNGRRPQILTWKFVPPEEKKEQNKENYDSAKQRQNQDTDKPTSAFRLVPEKLKLEPDTSIVMTIEAYSAVAHRVVDRWECTALVGMDRRTNVIYQTDFCADFVAPLLKFSMPSISFTYMYHPTDESSLQSQPISITNVTSLPLVCWLKCPPPFGLDQMEFDLQPGESTSTSVTFAANLKVDRVSERIKAAIVITYLNHKQRDKFPLYGNICFPNLSFSVPEQILDFGCVMNDTTKTLVLRVTNHSDIPANFQWSFLEPEVDDSLGLDEDNSLVPPSTKVATRSSVPASNPGSVSKVIVTGASSPAPEEPSRPVSRRSITPATPASEMFDILPVRGFLQPGESEDVEFSFFARQRIKANVFAVCSVQGGPEYMFNLTAESAQMSFKLSTTSLDFGTVLIGTSVTKEISINNTGRVPLNFTIESMDEQMEKFYEVGTTNGVVAAKEKMIIPITFHALLPRVLDCRLQVQVGFFDPQTVMLMGETTFPRVTLSLPRVPHPSWNSRLEQARSEILSWQEREERKHALHKFASHKKRSSGEQPMLNLEEEVEADRLLFDEIAHEFQLSQSRTHSRNHTLAKESVATDHHKASRAFSRDSVIAEYACDFGDVILGARKTKTFVLTNKSNNLVTVEMDKSELAKSPFSVDPSRVSRLPPGGQIDFTVACSTNRGKFKTGKQHVRVYVRVRDGPALLILLNANLTVPDVVASSPHMDIGNVFLGQRKRVTFQLRNPSPVPCDWSFKPFLGMGSTPRLRDHHRHDPHAFKVDHSHGRLEPGGRINITLSFIPAQEHHYWIRMPISINLNPVVRQIVVKASGTKMEVRLQPPQLELGPVLPRVGSSLVDVTIVNPCNRALEVVSLDFDKRYIEEERILRTLTTYADDGSMFVTARGAGEPLNRSLIKQYRAHKAADGVSNEPEAEAEAETKATVPGVGGSTAQPTPSDSVPVSDVTASRRTLEVGSVCRNVMLVGSPYAGTTTAAHQVAESLQIPGTNVITLDQVVEFFVKKSTEPLASVPEETPSQDPDQLSLPQLLRQVTQLLVDGPLSIDPDMLSRMLAVYLQLEESQLRPPEPPSEVAEEAEHKVRPRSAHRHGKHSEPEAEPESVPDPAPLAPGQVQDYDYETMNLEDAGPPSVVHPFSSGLVIDGGLCSRLSEPSVSSCIRAVRGAFQLLKDVEARDINANNLHVVGLHVDAATAHGRWEKRKGMLHERLKDKHTLNTLKKFKVLSPEALAKKNEKQRIAYAEHLALHEEYEAAKILLQAVETEHKTRLDAYYEANTDSSARVRSEVVAGLGLEARMEDSARDPEVELCRAAFFEFSESPDSKDDVDDGTLSAVVSFASSSFPILKRLVDPDWVPPAVEDDVVKRPAIREMVEPPAYFALVDPLPPTVDLEEATESGKHRPTSGKNKNKKHRPTSGKKVKEEVEPVVDEHAVMGQAPRSKQTRWVVPANSELKVCLRVQFASFSTGVFNEDLRFFIVGDGPNSILKLPCKGVCGVPKISDDPRSVFMKRVKKIPKFGLSMPQFVLADSAVDFGSLLLEKDPALRFALDTVEYKEAHALTEKRVAAAAKAKPKDKKNAKDKKRPGSSKGGKKHQSQPEEKMSAEEKDARLKAMRTGAQKINRYVLRLANSGHFPIEMSLSFLNGGSGVAKRPETAESDKKKKGKHKVEDEPPAVFYTEPSTISIPVDDVREVEVWAFPQQPGEYHDKLVCTMKDNPDPVSFDLRCAGAKPQVTLSEEVLAFERLLSGQSDVKEIVITNTSIVAAVWSLEGVKDMPEEFKVEPSSGTLSPRESVVVKVSFRANEQKVHAHDLTLVIRDVESLLGGVEEYDIKVTAESFKFDVDVQFPENGLQYDVVRVGEPSEQRFSLKNKGKYPVFLQFAIDKKMYQLFSEVLKIEHSCSKLKEEQAVSGADLTSESKGSSEEKSPKKTQKKTEAVKKEPAEVLLTTPKTGIVQPQEQVEITVRLHTNDEHVVKSNGGLKLHLLEDRSNTSTVVVPVILSFESVFSKFRVIPSRGLNFGPLEINVPRQKKIEICNDGHFEFEYKFLTRQAAQEADESAQQTGLQASAPESKTSSKGKKGGSTAKTSQGRGASAGKSRKGGKGADVGQLIAGPFTLSSSQGTVSAGGSVVVDVTVLSSSPKVFQESLFLDISGRDPKLAEEADTTGLKDIRLATMQYDKAGRVRVDMLADVCSPGMETSNWNAVFEEQLVVKQLSKQVEFQNVFVEDERSFHFAPTVVQAGDPHDEKGVVMAEEADSSMLSRSRCERFRLFNPFKVPCDVTIYLGEQEEVKTGKSGKGNKGGKHSDKSLGQIESSVFRVNPTAVHIPSHESRFISVSFEPTSLGTASTLFTASVAKGVDPKTNSLSFTVTGKGTLPHLSLVQPSARDDRGLAFVKFPRVFVNREPYRTRQITVPYVVRNDGVVPATARFDMVPPSSSFRFSGLGQLVTVEPHAEKKLWVNFQPREPGLHETKLHMSVLHNSFDDTEVALSGMGYSRDVTIDGLIAEEHATEEHNHVQFSDVPLGKRVEKSFTLFNHSDSTYRFVWQYGSNNSIPDDPRGETRPHDHFAFSPSIGHIAPHSAKIVVLSFLTHASMSYDHEDVTCALSKIRYSVDSEMSGDWDNSHTVTREVTAAELKEEEEARAKAAKGADKKNSKDKTKTTPQQVEIPDDPDAVVSVTTVVPEPAFTLDEPQDAAAAKKKEKEKAKKATTKKKDKKGGSSVDIEEEEDELHLAVSVSSDAVRYECDVEELPFRRTMMFQVRTAKVTVKNTSAVVMDFAWKCAENHHDTFSIAPAEGTVPANSTRVFTVTFAPQDAREYRTSFECSMPNLDSQLKPLRLSLSGSSARPKCHFELTASDYLTAGRRAPDMVGPDGTKGPLESGYQVVEVESLGIKVRNTRRFYVLNPTNTSFRFDWRRVDNGSDCFTCLTPQGIVAPGKKFEMVFTFIPTEEATVESFWRFAIKDYTTDLSVPILLVGHVVEPDVQLSHTHVNFHARQLGTKESRTIRLVNREHIPFPFTVDRGFSVDGVFDIQPRSGVIGPDSEHTLTVTFHPKLDRDFNVTSLIHVKRKPQPLTLNLKGEGFSVQALVEMEDGEPGTKGPPAVSDSPPEQKQNVVSPVMVELLETDVTNVDLQEVYVHERHVRKIHIRNLGKYPFDFTWALPSSQKVVSISPQHGLVKAGERIVVEVLFKANKEMKIENLRATCTLSNAVVYSLSLSAVVRKPAVEFSMLEYNFGPCFVRDVTRQGAASVPITVINKDKHRTVSFASHYSGSAINKGGFMEIGPVPSLLSPNTSTQIMLYFAPREAKSYKENISFNVNGTSTYHFHATGEGIPLRLELADPSMGLVDFKPLRVRENASASRQVTLVNRSRKAVSFTLLTSKTMEEKTPKDLSAFFVDVDPGFGVKQAVKARQTKKLTLTFAPKTEVPVFNQQVYILLEGSTEPQPLLTVAGVSYGIGLRLESDTLPFGAVVQKSSVTKRIAMENVGDVSLPFRWVLPVQVLKDLRVVPEAGHVPARGTLAIDVTFHPHGVAHDIQHELKCEVSEKGVPDMFLTVSGDSIEASTETAPVLTMECKLRQSTSASVTLENPTSFPWSLRPSFDGQYWSGASVVEIPPHGTATYNVLFKPMTVGRELPPETEQKQQKPSKGGKKKHDKKEAAVAAGACGHQGTLFFALPDGKAILYRLVGVVASPDAEGGVKKVTVACKKQNILNLSVKNHLDVYQRYDVAIEAPQNSSVVVDGMETLDVPGGATRQYRLSFFALKPGESGVKVTFQNKETGDVIVHELSLVAGPMEADTSTPALRTPVRQETMEYLSVSNPLATDATISSYKVDPAMPDVFLKLPITVPAKSTAKVPVHFRPLSAHKDMTAVLSLSSDTLGDYAYQLTLSAAEVGADQTLRLSAALGSQASLEYRFRSYSTQTATYSCSVSSGEFIVSPTVQAPAASDTDGVEVSVPVVYEPSSMGDVKDEIVVKSGTTVYRCVLHGHCDLPEPQGPVLIKKGGSGTATFKNVLDNDEDFKFTVDRPCFVLKKTSERVKRKSPVTIVVEYKPDKTDDTGPPHGKLVVTCASLKDVNWVFYLQGVTQ